MNDYIGTMGIITTFGNIKSDNKDEAIESSSSGALVHCIGQSESVLECITWNGIKFTTESKDYRLLGIPNFYVGDRVYDPVKDRKGKIRFVFYHFERKEFYYQVDFDGKKSNRWFFDNELQKAE